MPVFTKPTELPEWASSQPVINGWAASTAYTLNTLVSNGGAIYECTTAGTSASSGSGPSGAGTGIADGTAVWRYSHAALRAGPVVEPSSAQKANGFTPVPPTAPLPTGLLNWMFRRLGEWIQYLSSFQASSTTWTGPQSFQQTLSATNDPGTAWAPSTAYAVDTIRTNDSGKVYIVTQAGTSAGSGGPTGTGQAIADGTVTWMFLRGPAPAITGTTTVTGQAGVRGVGTADGAGPGLATSTVLLLEGLAADPASPANGAMWHHLPSNTIRVRLNGLTVTVTTA